ncbi:hypothetical protein FB192DRAFT_1280731 [Mucor lusitanicus]|uniref:FYVE-type domain-containing protein n=1 Tax=Mucor circinelloides f. lusitanicus TaxID=29924 RepID=A0A8H4BGF9_MUCCL|nr:hypothetical protein FB192DRAFT_1280731 [Mucor lusitanicus]
MDSNSSFTFDQVTGSPTREHWKRDSDSTACEYIGCLTKFGLFERRHHCRKCGDIFCSLHCSNYFRLDQYAQFHPKGLLSRGCDKCALDYIQWQEQVRRGGDTKRQPADKPAAKKRQDSNIMTPKPQAMEGVTELGRDGKLCVCAVGRKVEDVLCSNLLGRHCCTTKIDAVVKRGDYKHQKG